MVEGGPKPGGPSTKERIKSFFRFGKPKEATAPSAAPAPASTESAKPERHPDALTADELQQRLEIWYDKSADPAERDRIGREPGVARYLALQQQRQAILGGQMVRGWSSDVPAEADAAEAERQLSSAEAELTALEADVKKVAEVKRHYGQLTDGLDRLMQQAHQLAGKEGRRTKEDRTMTAALINGVGETLRERAGLLPQIGAALQRSFEDLDLNDEYQSFQDQSRAMLRAWDEYQHGGKVDAFNALFPAVGNGEQQFLDHLDWVGTGKLTDLRAQVERLRPLAETHRTHEQEAKQLAEVDAEIDQLLKNGYDPATSGEPIDSSAESGATEVRTPSEVAERLADWDGLMNDLGALHRLKQQIAFAPDAAARQRIEQLTAGLTVRLEQSVTDRLGRQLAGYFQALGLIDAFFQLREGAKAPADELARIHAVRQALVAAKNRTAVEGLTATTDAELTRSIQAALALVDPDFSKRALPDDLLAKIVRESAALTEQGGLESGSEKPTEAVTSLADVPGTLTDRVAAVMRGEQPTVDLQPDEIQTKKASAMAALAADLTQRVQAAINSW